MTSILFVGDVVGAPGRHTLRALLPGLKEELGVGFAVVNGENAAGGMGITAKTARDIFAAGADVITLGNHTYRHREVYGYLDEEPSIVRPVNFLPSQPGHGTAVVERGGVSLGVVSVSGNLHMNAARPAFVEIEGALDEVARADLVLVDVHAEATSEKVAMGWHLDGRVAAVVGTHTHVPTNDFRVLPGGTAYISDVGMTGGRGGVIGVRKEISLEVMRTQMPVRYETTAEDPWLMAVLVRCSSDGRAESIEPVLRPMA